jgi:tetratricopeptide (TPR) repeat protein
LAARQVAPGFTLSPANQAMVARICHLVSGMPLGIELAAGWMLLFSPEEIVRQAERSLDFLSTTLHDIPQRQRVRAAFGSSGLLSPAEQRAFCLLAVFRGHFDLQAAGQVAGLSSDLLAGLAAKSLVRPSPHPRPLSRRERVATKCVAWGWGSAWRCTRCCANTCWKSWSRPTPGAADPGARRLLPGIGGVQGGLNGEQWQALDALRADLPNLRAAWDWAIAHRAWALLEAGLEGLFLFYYVSSWFLEGEQAFAGLVRALRGDVGQTVSLPNTGGSETLLGRALAGWGWFTFQVGNPALARKSLQESVALLRADAAQRALPFSLNYLGALALQTGDPETARRLCQESLELCRSLDDRYGAAVALNILGSTAFLQQDYPAARQACQASLALAQELGNLWSAAFSLHYLGQVAAAQADHAAARRFFEHSLTIRQTAGDQRGVGLCLVSLGEAAQSSGDPAAAVQLFTQASQVFQAVGHQAGAYTALARLARLARRRRPGCRASALHSGAADRHGSARYPQSSDHPGAPGSLPLTQEGKHEPPALTLHP